MSQVWVGDLETTHENNVARVWASGMYNPYTDEFEWGKDMNWTINFMYSNPGKYYYHNLKFDGNFIISYLLKNGFQHTKNEKLKVREFSTIISDMGQFYKIKICMRGGVKVEIFDSLKIIPMPVERFPKTFGLEECKGSIDYDKYRPVGYEPDKNEIEYLKKDCWIVGQGLKYFFRQRVAQNDTGFKCLLSA